MSKPRRHIQRNHALRNELIAKGLITPTWMVPARLRERGYEVAADAAQYRLAHRLPLYRR